MGWLRSLLGGVASGRTAPELDPGLRRLLDDHGLLAFDRQLAFAGLAGERDWLLDQDAGELRLGDDLHLPMQILGSVSLADRTWRWAWANPSVMAGLTLRAHEAARIGADRRLTVLTDPDVGLERLGDGHNLALAVAGLLDADAYHRCPHPGGEVFVLVDAPAVRQVSMPPIERATSVVAAALFGLPAPVTRAGITSYLRALDLPLDESDREVRLRDPDGPVFRFDRQGRLAGMDGPGG